MGNLLTIQSPLGKFIYLIYIFFFLQRHTHRFVDKSIEALRLRYIYWNMEFRLFHQREIYLTPKVLTPNILISSLIMIYFELRWYFFSFLATGIPYAISTQRLRMTPLRCMVVIFLSFHLYVNLLMFVLFINICMLFIMNAKKCSNTKNNRAIEFRKCICIKTMERNQTFNQDHWIRKDKGVSLSAAKKNNLDGK